MYDHRAAMLFVVCCVPVIFSILILGLLAGRAMTAARPGRNRVQVHHNSSDKRRCVAYHQVHKAAGSTVLSILRAHPTRASGIAPGPAGLGHGSQMAGVCACALHICR